ncbi:MAG TPA: hypothetical protein VK102_05570 [Sphingobacterium sp.]|nr:hypothetical protein [Sphingobacterium sp.]
MRYAAIDIGSNGVRLLIADIIKKRDGSITFHKHTLLRVPIRLGNDVFIQGYISDKKVRKMVQTMHAFHLLMKIYDVSTYFACATSAMRDAKNGKKIVKACAEKGVNIKVIDGAQEAEIIYKGQLARHVENDKTYLYIDIGGGSTEISLFHKGELIASKSYNLGTIRILDGQDKAQVWSEMRKWVQKKTQSYNEIYGIGSGGNINKLSRLINKSKDDKPFDIYQLKDMKHVLSSLSIEERIEDFELKADRADVIVPAADLLLAIMEAGRLKNIMTPRIGVVDGIIRSLIRKELS